MRIRPLKIASPLSPSEVKRKIGELDRGEGDESERNFRKIDCGHRYV